MRLWVKFGQQCLFLPIWRIPSGKVVRTKKADTVTNIIAIFLPPYLPSVADSVLVMYRLCFAACLRRSIINMLHTVMIIDGAMV